MRDSSGRDKSGTASIVHFILFLALAALIPILFLIGSLGDSNRNSPSTFDNGRQRVIEQLLAASPFATPPPGSSPTPVRQASAVAGAQPLKQTTTDNKFSDTKLTAKANAPVSLAVNNNGQAIHNWHLLDVKNADGSDIKTDLLDPGKSQTINFTIAKPGTYKFQCDVHPTEMTGTLTVS